MSATTLAFDILAKDNASDKFNKVGRASSTLGDKLKHVAKVGLLGIGAAAAVAGVALVGMAKAAMEDQQSQVILANALKNSAGATKAQVAATEDWISKQGIALGVTDDELRPALSKLVAVTKDVGKAQTLASLAMDVSAGTHKSLSTVSAALAKAQLGQVSGLARLGVQTKNVDGSTKSLKDITEDLAKTYSGAAAASADTAQGKFDRLKLIFDETKESIGSKLLPVLTDMSTWILEKAVPAVSDFVSGMQDGTGAGGVLADVLGDVFGITKKAFGFIIDNKEAVGTFVGVILTAVAATKAWAIVQVILNSALIANPLGLIVVAVAALAAGMVYAYQKSDTFRGIVNKLWDILKPFGEFIGKTFVGFVKLLASGWLLMGEYGVKAFRLLLTAAFAVFGGILAAADKGLSWIPGLGGKISDAKDAFAEFSDKTVDKLKAVEDGLHKTRDAINGIKSKDVDLRVHVRTIYDPTTHDFIDRQGGHDAYLQTGAP